MSLQEKFAQAGIPLVVARKPLFGSVRRGAGNVFQMTTRPRTKKHDEHVLMFLGADDNDVRVINIDKDYRQAVLSVHEPRRTFYYPEYNRETGKWVETKETTPKDRRMYLVGFDTTELFIAELPKGASSVKVAHDLLKPDKVKGSKKTKRQGEWFFTPVTASEDCIIDENIALVMKGVLPGNTANAHQVDELLEVEGKIFVRGRIRHPEHKTMRLLRWYTVTRNKEAVPTEARLKKVKFID